MSFGFSAGDAVAVTQLLWQLRETLRDIDSPDVKFDEFVSTVTRVHESFSQLSKFVSTELLDEPEMRDEIGGITSTAITTAELALSFASKVSRRDRSRRAWIAWRARIRAAEVPEIFAAFQGLEERLRPVLLQISR